MFLPIFYFCSDLHGRKSRYEKVRDAIRENRPQALFLGGDLLPSGWSCSEEGEGFFSGFLVPQLTALKNELQDSFPEIFLILGNDDPRAGEAEIEEIAETGLWKYMHMKKACFSDYAVYGYSHVPPSPFMLKDWERYDVSRYVDPGCFSPEEGFRSVPVSGMKIRNSTIEKDLETLAGERDLSKSVFLFHGPPYSTCLDRAALDGKMVDHVPLDCHVGSIAIKRFIEKRQPLVTLHGHIHESSRLTGQFKEMSGKTVMLQAAHDGPELCLISFDPRDPWNTAEKKLL